MVFKDGRRLKRFRVVGRWREDGSRPTSLEIVRGLLSFPMRLRVGPSLVQIYLDRISYGEDLFAAKMGSSDSFFVFFFDFAQNSISLFPREPPFASLLRRTVQSKCDDNHIKFHGQPVGINGVRALLHCAPYAADETVSSALKSLEDARIPRKV